MTDLDLLRHLFAYGDWANDQLVGAGAPLSADQLDRPFDIGPGSLRRTLLHILIGEEVWLARWQGEVERKWGGEREPVEPATIAARFTSLRAPRTAFLSGLRASDLDRVQTYRDSKGSLFTATLRDMLIQGHMHGTHHRAQAVNILRRLGLGTPPPELDYMMHVRTPA